MLIMFSLVLAGEKTRLASRRKPACPVLCLARLPPVLFHNVRNFRQKLRRCPVAARPAAVRGAVTEKTDRTGPAGLFAKFRNLIGRES